MTIPTRWVGYRVETAIPDEFAFDQNFPNPFNPTTTFRFSLPVRASVKLEVFNILGQKVATIADQTYEAGTYDINWDGVSSEGFPITSGVYFAKFTSKDFSSTRKVVVVK
ncbi:hypothetical protein TRIP_C20150 [Candidatus Zixiibacteriota bacterium]|nr:hypothetical protein TRIP_C20150 [candidate division Zixibacteria bacterium]